MINNESFVLYESAYKQFDRLLKRGNVDGAVAFIKATMEFGLYGLIPDDDNIAWDYGLEQTITSISAAKDRRQKNQEDGSLGGRPRIELSEEEVMNKKKELKTWKAVAAYYNISENTLRKMRDDWENAKTSKTQKPQIEIFEESQKPQKLKNLNVNENVNETETENDKSSIDLSSLFSKMNSKNYQVKEDENYYFSRLGF